MSTRVLRSLQSTSEYLTTSASTTKQVSGGIVLLSMSLLSDSDMFRHRQKERKSIQIFQKQSNLCRFLRDHRNVTLPFMLTQHSKYMTDYSERLEANVIKRGIDRVSFQKEPRAESVHWDILQRLDPRTLFLCHIPQGMSKNSAFDDLIAEMRTHYGKGENIYETISRCTSQQVHLPQNK